MTARSLHLAPGLSLPLDAVSRTFGILAVRGAGKSNTAAVMAEEMFGAGLPFVVIDPVGSWYGLRSSSDGKSPGLPIPIFGGKHGDVPLERGAGELIADLVVEKRLTCVLDLSRFDSEADKKAFLLAFARRLYLKNENPLHLFLEEADDYIPQSPMGDEKQLLRAWENIVRRGRARGLGMTLITQRSAAVAKMVLTQVETLFAMRTTGPQDIEAIKAWIQYHQVGKEVLSTLSSLEDGEAWVWSPHYLKSMNRHQIRRRATFDSGATPANVRAKDTRPPATLADIDIVALQDRMAATIEKARADDPKELRRQIAELKRDLASTVGTKANAETTKNTKSTPVLTDADRALLAKVREGCCESARMLGMNAAYDLETLTSDIVRRLESFKKDVLSELDDRRGEFFAEFERKALQKVITKLATVPAPQITPTTNAAPRSPLARRVAPALAQATSSRPARQVSIGDAAVGKSGLRRMLIALAQRPNGLTRGQLGVRAQVSSKGGSFDTYLSKARVNGWIDSTGERIQITDLGLEALGEYTPLPTGPDLLNHYLGQFGNSGAARMLAALAGAYPSPLSRAELSERSNVSAVGGSFDTYLSKLRTLELIAAGKELRASEELFD